MVRFQTVWQIFSIESSQRFVVREAEKVMDIKGLGHRPLVKMRDQEKRAVVVSSKDQLGWIINFAEACPISPNGITFGLTL